MFPVDGIFQSSVFEFSGFDFLELLPFLLLLLSLASPAVYCGSDKLFPKFLFYPSEGSSGAYFQKSLSPPRQVHYKSPPGLFAVCFCLGPLILSFQIGSSREEIHSHSCSSSSALGCREEPQFLQELKEFNYLIHLSL